jgi:hypothetical protein
MCVDACPRLTQPEATQSIRRRGVAVNSTRSCFVKRSQDRPSARLASYGTDNLADETDLVYEFVACLS